MVFTPLGATTATTATTDETLEMQLRRAGQCGLQGADDAKKAIVDFIIYRKIVNQYIERCVQRLLDEGLSERVISELTGLSENEIAEVKNHASGSAP